MDRFKRRFYDSHPGLPLDPDSDELQIVRPIHTDPAHIAVVAFGAFFGTLGRYQLGLWLLPNKSGWPMVTLVVNICGALLLGLLPQALFHHGKDEGGRRILRLMLGTGFLGAFTTYSSLAVGIAVLARDGHPWVAIQYAAVSIILGIGATMLGIRLATRHHHWRKGRV
jgi:CrcB protein